MERDFADDLDRSPGVVPKVISESALRCGLLVSVLTPQIARMSGFRWVVAR